MAKLLFVNLPYAGHTNPTLPLTEELVQRGHEVAYINAPEMREKIEKTGAHFIPYDDYPAGLGVMPTKMHCFEAAFKTALAVGKDYDMLVYELLFYVGKELANRLGKPCVRQFSQPAWNESTAKNASRVFQLGCRLIDAQMMNRRTRKTLNIWDKSMMDAVLSDVPELNIVYVPELFQSERETFDERFVFCCPAAPPKPAQKPFLDYATLKKPFIYISLGSILSSRAFCRRCVKAFGDKPMTIVLNTGKVAPESLGKLPKNILAYSFVPQMEILQNSNLFITHCGMNSVNEAMTLGVPMLGMPVLNDQPVNAEQIERLNIGIRIRAFPQSADALFSSAVAVLENGIYRENSRALSERIRKGFCVADAAERIEAML